MNQMMKLSGTELLTLFKTRYWHWSCKKKAYPTEQEEEQRVSKENIAVWSSVEPNLPRGRGLVDSAYEETTDLAVEAMVQDGVASDKHNPTVDIC
jgi:hypothetical protein